MPAKNFSRLSFQYTAAGLFTKRCQAWPQNHIFVRRVVNTQWIPLNMEALSPMGAFGYRQRLDRVLQETEGGKFSESVRRRLAVWIAKRYEKLTPKESAVVAVRFATSVWPTNSPDMAIPSGHWVRNPSVLPAAVSFVTVATYAVDVEGAKLVVERQKAQTVPATPQVFQRGTVTQPAEAQASPKRKTP
jgi:hypothetical protein